MDEKELIEKIEKLEKRAEELEKELDKLKAIEFANLYGNLVRLQCQASWSWTRPIVDSQNMCGAVQGFSKNCF